jgi:hypothetical protein
MSNEIALFGGKQLPAYLQNAELDAATKALAGGGASGRRISIKGGVFRMIVDSKQVAENEDRAMNVVVVAAAPSINRQYYKNGYEEGVAAAADCYSEDGKTPAKDSQNRQSTSCDSCPQNIAGSGQGEARACRYQQRLAVVLDGDLSGTVYQLALPATSLFGKGEPNGKKMPLQAYARHLASNGVPITAVVTEARFDTASATPKLTFSPVRPLTEEEYATSQEQGNSVDAQQAIKLTVFKQDGEKAVSKSEAKRVEVQKAAPVAEVAEEEAEPTVAKAAKAKPTAPASKRPVSELISEWDDE